jgi:catechol 1,2-dioxygenase
VQDSSQDPANLRGLFTTDDQGRYQFGTVRPVIYSIPDDGPVGQMLHAVGRHPMRAAHVHLIVSAPGYHPVTTHVFDAESAYLDSDAVFGVRDSLVRTFEPDGSGGLQTTFDVVLTPVEGDQPR